jgi:hypothetical protein
MLALRLHAEIGVQALTVKVPDAGEIGIIGYYNPLEVLRGNLQAAASVPAIAAAGIHPALAELSKQPKKPSRPAAPKARRPLGFCSGFDTPLILRTGRPPRRPRGLRARRVRPPALRSRSRRRVLSSQRRDARPHSRCLRSRATARTHRARRTRGRRRRRPPPCARRGRTHSRRHSSRRRTRTLSPAQRGHRWARTAWQSTLRRLRRQSCSPQSISVQPRNRRRNGRARRRCSILRRSSTRVARTLLRSTLCCTETRPSGPQAPRTRATLGTPS